MSGPSGRRSSRPLQHPPAAIRLNDRSIGSGSKCFVIAEIGVNHGGDLDTALALVDAAAACGADAVKTQTFVAEELATAEAALAAYQERSTEARSQVEMLRSLELSRSDHEALRARAAIHGLVFLSTPFDEGSVEMLVQLEVPAFKISSGDLNNHQLLHAVGGRGKPVLLSTGMSDLDEIRSALSVLVAAGNPPTVLLHCVSGYPVEPSAANLQAIATLREEFGVPVGYSDHTNSLEVVLGAIALGAVILEEHLTLDRSAAGPDHPSSLEPGSFSAMVRAIRILESAMGDGSKLPSADELEMAKVARRSLVAARDLPAGHILSAGDVLARRPGTGIPPSDLSTVLDRELLRPLPAGALLSENDLA